MSQSDGIKETIPITPMQAGMLLVSGNVSRSGTYVTQLVAHFEENLDVGLFQQSWTELAARHAVLRTKFEFDSNLGWTQYIFDHPSMDFHLGDWGAAPQALKERAFDDFLQRDRERGFTLERDPPSRISLFRLGCESYRMLWTMHHVLLDGRSITYLIKEVLSIYDAAVEFRALHLPDPCDYSEYLSWLHGFDPASSEQFWRQQLAQSEAISTEVKRRPRTHIFAGESEVVTDQLRLPEDVSAEMYDLANQSGLTVNTFSLGAWALLAGCYTGGYDVLIGVVRSCRWSLPEHLRSVAGLVINTVPLRVQLPQERTVADWLKGLRSQWVGLRAHEMSPVRNIRQWCDWPVAKPMFSSIHAHDHRTIDVIMSEQNRQGTERKFELITGRTEAPLSVSTFAGAQFQAMIYADEEMFTPLETEQLAARYQTIIEQMVRHPERKLGALDRLTPWERERLLVDFNRPMKLVDHSMSVMEVFRSQVFSEPGNPALVAAGTELTYGQLFDSSTGLAGMLREVDQRGPVGILVGSEPAFVVALFAALMADSGFVPLDPQYPEERLAFMLKDCGARVIVAGQNNRDLAVRILEQTQRSGVVLVLDNTRLAYCGPDACDVISVKGDGSAAPDSPQPMEDLVYIVYTSGTTGQPKGIPITSANLMPLMRWQEEHFGLSSQTRTAQTLSVSFDFGLQEIFTTILFGGTLFCPPSSVHKDPGEYAAFVQQHRISMIYTTPSFMEAVLSVGPQLDSLRILLLGGERLSWELVDDLSGCLHEDCLIFNGYGPTEAAINCCMYKIRNGDTDVERIGSSVPIGLPTGRSRLYVLDERLQPAPLGVPGELYIGGPGVAKGYLDRPSLTNQKFIVDTFSNEASARLYRTGDLVVHLPDGNLEFLGRLDNQVKVRGYRIELEEVESNLLQHPEVVSAAAVVEDTDDGHQHIVAYAVADNEHLSTEQIRRFARKRLPNFMVPAKIWLLGSLPLTEAGKVDRSSLRPPQHPIALHTIPPANRSQHRVRAPYEEWFYKPVWKPAPIADNEGTMRVDSTGQRWLIVGNHSNFENNLITALEHHNKRTLRVVPSSAYVCRDRHTYAINPSRGADYEQLFDDLASTNQTLTTVVFLQSPQRGSEPENSIDPDCERLLYLLQAVGKHYRARDLHLCVITFNAQAVSGDDLLYPRGALLSGMCKALPYEFPTVRCTNVDLDQREVPSAGLIQELAADLVHSEPGLTIALRNGVRYALSFEKLPPRAEGGELKRPVRGAYLITGGLGAIALELAEALHAQRPAGFALLDVPAAHDNAALRSRLRKLTKLGAEVLLLEADICDPAQVSFAMRQIRSRFGEVAGVIHAAGRAEPQIIRQLTPAKAARVLAPKVEGTEILAAELESYQPDFVLLCSSIDAIRGNFGQADYCAANAFEDAFAHHMRQQGLPYTAVNWDVWQEVGMAARVKVSPAVEEARRRELGLGISSMEGGRVLATVMGFNEPQIVVSTTDLAPRIGRFFLALDEAEGRTGQEPADTPGWDDRLIESKTLEIFAAALADASIRAEDDFFKRGGDSLSAMRVVARLREVFGLDLPMGSVFESPTAASMAELLRFTLDQE